MKTRIRFSVLITILLISLDLFSMSTEEITGEVFKKDSSRKELLYKFKNIIQTDDKNLTVSDAQFLDLDSKVVVKETSHRQGSKLVKYEMEHLQTNRKGSIVVDNGNILFNLEENGKKKSVETEKLKDNFVVGHTLLPYVSEHWKEIMDGKTIDIQFGVWDRQETVGFSLFKIGQEKLNEQDVILLKFKPTSFVISALVDPVIFKFSMDGKQLEGMIGRVVPKKKDGEKWKDLDAEVIYKSIKK